MPRNALVEISYGFSVEVVKTCLEIIKNKREYVLSKQLMKSATSIGANIEEANGAQSKKDFRAKMFIAYKESRETKYWIRLLKDTDLLNPTTANELIAQNHDLCRLLGKTLSTLKNKHN
jgi:four helix bundle protein